MEKYKLPTIEFTDFYLREIKVSDYKDMFIYGSDLEVVKYLSWGPYHHKREAKRTIKRLYLPRPKRKLPVGYAIIDKISTKMIGTIDFHTLYNGNKAEIGYVLNKDYWNRGIITRAVKKMIELGFEKFEYDVIIICHVSKNIASKKVILKNNLRYCETKEKEFYLRDTRQFDDIICYQMTKNEYYSYKRGEENDTKS